VGYVGTAGTRYRFDVTASCYQALLGIRPDVQFLIINRGEHSDIRDRLAAAGIPDAAIELKSSLPSDVPGEMARMGVTIFFIEPSFSKLAMAPTRLAEFLGCGIPCLTNTGVGDMAELLEGEKVGIALDALDAGSLRSGLQRLLTLLEEPGIGDRCVAAAKKHFSLDEGVQRYAAVYRSLLGQS
jgi:glycosyltransferase involved in cell wall biosynthesis